MRFPMPAIVSILHRISGVFLFLLIPFILWALSLSLESSQQFEQMILFLTSPLSKFIIWVLLSAFIYHFVAGIRHLLLDIGIGEELRSGTLGAYLTLGLSVGLIILSGIWLW